MWLKFIDVFTVKFYIIMKQINGIKIKFVKRVHLIKAVALLRENSSIYYNYRMTSSKIIIEADKHAI